MNELVPGIEFSDLNDRLDNYVKTGEIGSFLSLRASMALHDASYGWERIRPELAQFEQRRIELLARVAVEVQDIHFKMKEFEFKHWMGFCDEDVKALMVLYRKWTYFDWERETKEAGDDMRDLWSPHPNGSDWENYWRPQWKRYLDRRDKKPLKDTCLEDAPCSATTDHLKVLMGSTAGRVLITVQDRFKQDDKRAEFGGAQVTMIFDESAGYPRGGLQGQCATRDEGVALLRTLIDHMPKMKPDKNISIC